MTDGFDNLVPETLVLAAEAALGRRLEPVAVPFASYINRVYELRGVDGEHVVAKFYRPGRWSRAALLEEHAFMCACVEDDIPIAAPLELTTGGTLGEVDNIMFALFPKRAGRRFEPLEDEDWIRLGMLTARVHNAGDRVSAAHRPKLTPQDSTAHALNRLLAADFIAAAEKSALAEVVSELMAAITPEFEGEELITVHGDLHGGNILIRPPDGLTMIDFDDMACAPAAQDIWVLLPDYAQNATRELELLLEGYRDFRYLPTPSWRLLEGLRAMHMVYYLDWCARQSGDFMFRRNFPEWGTPGFWRAELAALNTQLDMLLERQSQKEDDGFDAWDY